MRRRDGSGEKELRGATEVIWWRIVSGEEGWKRMRSFNSVIRRVFEGGDGCESGGTREMSMEREGREERFAGCERGGDVDSAILSVVLWWLKEEEGGEDKIKGLPPDKDSGSRLDASWIF